MVDQKITFPSREWVSRYCSELSASEEYNKAGKGWKDPILFKVEEEAGLSLELSAFVLNLMDGKCLSVEFPVDAAKASAPFTIQATYDNWKKVIEGKINPTQAMLMGQLKVKGNMALLLRYSTAAIAMVKAAQRVPTQFLR
ncbi:Fis family transcriptional regulator [Thermocladium modestius]|uniref:Fis family transcriptional regulator n=1 Tax=Thermocladium modestius TaxID=62609 RepID=A0A830GW75_9CREN|nr:SCP2 sterol-binding domain-containing protein [Thermocladium modestius]GGP21554.1 Fis family transcriptional regulator [Thermocladium modestius]